MEGKSFRSRLEKLMFGEIFLLEQTKHARAKVKPHTCLFETTLISLSPSLLTDCGLDGRSRTRFHLDATCPEKCTPETKLVTLDLSFSNFLPVV